MVKVVSDWAGSEGLKVETKFPPSWLVEGRHGEDGLRNILLTWRSRGVSVDIFSVDSEGVFVDALELETKVVLVAFEREGADFLAFWNFFSSFKWFLIA